MRFRHLLQAALVAGALASSGAASAEDPQAFIEREHTRLEQLMKQPETAGRNEQINQVLHGMIDYNELARRAFGEPCPINEPGCKNLWATFDEAQRAKLKDLLRQIVDKSYRRNLKKTVDYKVEYRGTRDAQGNTRILTEAKSLTKPRDPAVRVDYLVKSTPQGNWIVDLITEGSWLAKNYYDQFRKMSGYDEMVKKLEDKINKRD
jgi:phospholipid transport system substrate-binding protein